VTRKTTNRATRRDKGAIRDDWAERFLAKIDMGAPDECWEWRGDRAPFGHGRLTHAKRQVLAHRLAYALWNGDLPADAFICHHCDNPPCCNPAHLYAGTHRQNMRDKVVRGRTSSNPGESNGYARLTDEEVLMIRSDWATGRWKQRELAARYGTSQANVWQIVNRKKWRHLAA
jgi:hypothetical protein